MKKLEIRVERKKRGKEKKMKETERGLKDKRDKEVKEWERGQKEERDKDRK